jgi:hypothetical protein
MDDTTAAHQHCRRHRAAVLASGVCGCFYCQRSFPPAAIAGWVHAGQTALCPLCGINAVLGDASGIPITAEFLAAMHHRWFAQTTRLGRN